MEERGRPCKGASEGDLRLWKKFTEDIQPLRWEKPDPEPEMAPEATAQPKPRPREHMPAPSQGRLPGGHEIDGNTDERLRKGKLPIEGTLDLHTMTQDQAEKALIDFILTAYARKQRCLNIITGKGLSRNEGEHEDWMKPKRGILKARLPEWLSKLPLSEIVLKHYPAPRELGGEGARLIYLRRKRD